jgi:hypothetical protein
MLLAASRTSRRLVSAARNLCKGGRTDIETTARQTGRRSRGGRERGEGRCWCFGGEGSR